MCTQVREPVRGWVGRMHTTLSSAAVGVALAGFGAGAFAQGTLMRASLGQAGAQGDAGSLAAKLSSDGRLVAFSSSATNLVPDDSNGIVDVFVQDRASGLTTRVSVAADGTQADDGSGDAAISADGRFVAFASRATNLVAGDTNGCFDVFVRDLQTGSVQRVSVSSAGVEGDRDSYGPALSADGRYVAFYSWARNLVSGDTNDTSDVFVFDTQSGTCVRASVSSSGVQGNSTSDQVALSADGRTVAFASTSTNLSAGLGSGVANIFVRDLVLGVTSCASLDPAGLEGDSWSLNPALSPDARWVAFRSYATNLVPADGNEAADILVHDRSTGVTTRASLSSTGVQANADCEDPQISSDGRYVLFTSSATNLVAGDSNGVEDVFLRDRLFGTTILLSNALAGAPANGESLLAAFTPDTRFVSFTSGASNLVPGDTNASWDVFWIDRAGPASVVANYCHAASSSHGCVSSLSASGHRPARARARLRDPGERGRGPATGPVLLRPFGPGRGALRQRQERVLRTHRCSARWRSPRAAGEGACDGRLALD